MTDPYFYVVAMHDEGYNGLTGSFLAVGVGIHGGEFGEVIINCM